MHKLTFSSSILKGELSLKKKFLDGVLLLFNEGFFYNGKFAHVKKFKIISLF